MELLPIKRAILSVTDKTGLIDFASFLVQANIELVSTGGTAIALANAGLPVTQVQDVTGFPEMLEGRVKTLHPFIHGGILADKDNPDHLETLKQHGIAPFDLVCVNLYDFAEAVRQRLPLEKAIEQIDIGGPCMLRAAAKNFRSVLVVPDSRFYGRIQKELVMNEMLAPLSLRQELAASTFAAVSGYDAMVAAYLQEME